MNWETSGVVLTVDIWRAVVVVVVEARGSKWRAAALRWREKAQAAITDLVDMAQQAQADYPNDRNLRGAMNKIRLLERNYEKAVASDAVQKNRVMISDGRFYNDPPKND